MLGWDDCFLQAIKEKILSLARDSSLVLSLLRSRFLECYASLELDNTR